MGKDLFDGIEIPDELLESVAGGVLSDNQRLVLDRMVLALKQNGTSLERTLEIVSASNEDVREDALAYVQEIW